MSWNFLGHVIGLPGGGKTWLARNVLVPEHLNAGGWALVHDPNCEYKALPYYTSADVWRAAAWNAYQGKAPMPRGAAIGGDVAAVIRLALELGNRHNRVDSVRMRVLLVVDETVLVRTSGRSWTGPEEGELMMRRRHLGIGVLFLAQDLQLDGLFYKLATDAWLFRLGNPKGLERLELAFGLPPGSLVDTVPRLADREHVHIQNGRGFV